MDLQRTASAPTFENPLTLEDGISAEELPQEPAIMSTQSEAGIERGGAALHSMCSLQVVVCNGDKCSMMPKW